MREVVQVKGLRELQAALRELPRKLERKVLNAALMTGARSVEREAKFRVPVDTGTLQRNIRARPGKPAGYTATVIVGVRKLTGRQISALKKKGKAADDPFYWRWIEFGTSKMAARPFLRPAFESKKYEAVTTIKDALRRRIEIEVNKLRKFKL